MIIRNTEGKGLKKLINYIQGLTKQDVVVGVTRSSNGARGNAIIAASHELGLGNNPERSFLRSTMIEQADKYAKLIGETIPQAIKSGTSERDAYSKLGTIAMNDVKLKIASGPFTPLKQATIDRKGSSKPLIDSGNLRQSITWEIR